MGLSTVLKTALKNKYEKLNGAVTKDSLFLPRLCLWEPSYNSIVAELIQHEFRFVENSDQVSLPAVSLTELLSCDCEHSSGQRTVVLLGVSGIGKTTTVQCCAVDWAEGNSYRNIHLLFPLTFWELNLVKDKLSFIELLQMFYPGLTELDASSLNRRCVWFVLDGLDEYRLSLKFTSPSVSDVSEVSTADVLVTSLISGTLLPKAHVWITSRHVAATQIPTSCLLKVANIQGFSDDQKKQHFQATICDDVLASRAIDHVKISRSLDFLSQIPSICTILANVFKKHLKGQGYTFRVLNLTQVYTNLIQTSNPAFIAKLKKLALQRLSESNLMYESDLLCCDISVDEASTFANESPLVLREEKGLHHASVFRFAQLSVLEFLAASLTMDNIEKKPSRSRMCQNLLDDSLRRNLGATEVFLRFVFGLIKDRRVLEPTDRLFEYTKKKILGAVPSYTAMGLLFCLREYDFNAFRRDAINFLSSGISPFPEFTKVHWDFIMNNTWLIEGMRINFEMELSTRCDENLLKQLPAIMKSRFAKLRFCNLTDECCPGLAGVLSASGSFLEVLDLGYNSITDSGVGMLAGSLTGPNSCLDALKLKGCHVTSLGCSHLAKALALSPRLKELDLTGNEIGDDGVKQLSEGLSSARCQLQVLKLSQCNIKWKGCSYLASALENCSRLRVLDLSINLLGDKGARHIFEMFDVLLLENLEMYCCGLTASSCKTIAQNVKMAGCTLVQLNLSNNKLEDEGFVALCSCLLQWRCLKKLDVSRCGIHDSSCIGFSNALVPELPGLLEVNLSNNDIGDRGFKILSRALTNPVCFLTVLSLRHCSLGGNSCDDLTLVFSRIHNIRILDLSNNDILDSGVKKLCVGLRKKLCKLQILFLRTCGLTSKSAEFLIGALKTNPKHLEQLHLLGNILEDSAIGAIVALTKNESYALKETDLSVD